MASDRLPYLPDQLRALIYAKANRQVVKRASSVNAVAREELRRRRANARRKSKAHGLWQGPFPLGFEQVPDYNFRLELNRKYDRTRSRKLAQPGRRAFRYLNGSPAQWKPGHEWNKYARKWRPWRPVDANNRIKSPTNSLLYDLGRVGPHTAPRTLRRLDRRYTELDGNRNERLRKARANGRQRISNARSRKLMKDGHGTARV